MPEHNFRQIEDADLQQILMAFGYAMNVDPQQFSRVLVAMARVALAPVLRAQEQNGTDAPPPAEDGTNPEPPQPQE